MPRLRCGAGRAAAVAVVAAVALLGLAGPGRAQTSGAPGSLTVLAVTPAVELGGTFQMRLKANGPATAQVSVKVHDRTTTRYSFQSTLKGNGFAGVLKTTTAPAQPDATGAVTISLTTRVDLNGPADALLIGPGVYPLEVALVDGRSTLDQIVTYLVVERPAPQGPPLGVGVVVPLTEGTAPSHGVDGSLGVTAADRTSMLTLAAAVASHPSVPVTFSAAGERLSGLTQAVDRATLRSVAPGRQVAPGAYVPLDAPSWLDAGMQAELGQEVDAGRAALSDAIAEPSTSTWVAPGPIDGRTAAWLSGRGFQAVVVPDDALSPLDPRRFNTTLTQPFAVGGGSGLRGVAADTALAAHVGSTGDDVLDSNHLLADLAILDLDRPGATRMAVVALPGATRPAFVDALLGGLQATRTLHAGTLDALLAATPTVGSRGEVDGTGTSLVRELASPSPTPLGDLPDQLRATEADIDTFRSTLLDADLALSDPLTDAALVGGDRTLGDDERKARLSGVRDRIGAELGRIGLPGRQTITFTDRDGTVGLAITNDTGRAVKVVLHLDGPKLELPGHTDGLVPLTLEADEATTRVQLAVRTRASGDSALDIAVETPDGHTTIGRTRVTIRSTAFSGLGIVLSAGALGFLLLWWGKHTLDARRARRRPPRHLARSGTDPA